MAFGPSSTTTFFETLTGWWSHAAAGGEWSFALDSADTLNTTMSAASIGATTISVGTTTSLATSDFVYIEDAADASKFESRKVTGISAAVLTFTTACPAGTPRAPSSATSNTFQSA